MNNEYVEGEVVVEKQHIAKDVNSQVANEKMGIDMEFKECVSSSNKVDNVGDHHDV